MQGKMQVIVSGGFDDIRSRDIRLLHEASKPGPVEVRLWSDKAIKARTGKEPQFPQPERAYLLEAIRFTTKVVVTDHPDDVPAKACIVVDSRFASQEREDAAKAGVLEYRVLGDNELAGFPEVVMPKADPGRKKVVVTGCFDWFHSGHVAMFEEVSRLGQLLVALGSDGTIAGLKGKEHPMFPQEERLYMVKACRFVSQAFISSGSGWTDYEPELRVIKPDLFVVNSDGDRPEKRNLCRELGIEYKVLERLPHAGLPRRESTRLRGY